MSKKADKELAEHYNERMHCEYWDWCETCPYPKCKYDCANLESFLYPMRYRCIKLCFEVFSSVALIQSVFRVSKATIYRALRSKK